MNSTSTIYRIIKSILYLMIGFAITAWLLLNSAFIINKNDETVQGYLNIFGDVYGALAIIAAVLGLLTAKNWGSLTSKLGRSISFISIGLLFQFLGQLTALYYTRVLGIDLPYPSWAELFYFGSIPIYILGVIFLMQACAININVIKKPFNIASILILMAGFMFLDYELFLYDYHAEDYLPIAVFLDYAYPILQSIQVSLVIFTYWFSLKELGGKLKWPVLFLIFGLYAQYLGDTIYTYLIYQEKWRQGDVTDFLYLMSYFLIGVSFIKFKSVYLELTTKKNASSN
ncbi:MAG: hypothetical protein E6Q58_02400 [Niabella sp.]|nr:MAG: hypothetical protein E6Q58_02400 [Niabella sp.]